MEKKFLVCIAFHFIPSRLDFLIQVISEVKQYSKSVTIIVDSNIYFDASILGEGVQLFVWDRLEHPYHLTWVHRQHFVKGVDHYDWIVYLEDDMLVPKENIWEYCKVFQDLWAIGAVPGFIRIEYKEEEPYILDALKPQLYKELKLFEKSWATMDNPYHAFWIMPTKEFKESLLDNFIRVGTSREWAASYPMWELQKLPLVQLEDRQISSLSYSYHISNTYSSSQSALFAVVPLHKVFKAG
jgi:hypothetical protein